MKNIGNSLITTLDSLKKAGDKAATKIQATFRMSNAKKKFKKLKEINEFTPSGQVLYEANRIPTNFVKNTIEFTPKYEDAVKAETAQQKKSEEAFLKVTELFQDGFLRENIDRKIANKILAEMHEENIKLSKLKINTHDVILSVPLSKEEQQDILSNDKLFADEFTLSHKAKALLKSEHLDLNILKPVFEQHKKNYETLSEKYKGNEEAKSYNQSVEFLSQVYELRSDNKPPLSNKIKKYLKNLFEE